MTTFLLRGGTLIGPGAGTTQRGDVLVRTGVIAAMGQVPRTQARGVRTVDAAGCYIAPGFIDMHAHVLHDPRTRSNRLPADRVGIQQGVACLVDAGSAGAPTIDAFPGAVHATQLTPVYALVNIGSPGLPNVEGGHSSRPDLVSLEATVHAIERHRAWVRGVKVQASGSHTGAFGEQAVKMARKAADLTGLPLMMHIGNAPPVLDDVLAFLRPGDIVTHALHGKVGGALTHGGRLLPALREAIARGVLIDVGHGRSSFAFATAERALAEGLPVHSISTDIHRANVEGPVVSLARTMSKLMLLGLSLEEVVHAVTAAPARALHLDADGFGSLTPGRPAHLTLFRVRDEPIGLEDAEGEVRRAERRVEPVAVYVHGERFDVTAPV